MTKWTIPDTPSPEAIVRAALERAAWIAENRTGVLSGRHLRNLASDRAEVTAIIKKAGERHD